MYILNGLRFAFYIAALAFSFDFLIVGSHTYLGIDEKQKDTDQLEKTEKNNDSWKKNLQEALTCLAVLSLVIAVGIVSWNSRKHAKVFIVICALTIVYHLVLAGKSVSTLGRIMYSEEKGKLSLREKEAIVSITSLLVLLAPYKIIDKLLEKIASNTNPIVHDLLISGTYLLLYMLFLFLIVFLISGCVEHFFELIRGIFHRLQGEGKIKQGYYFLLKKANISNVRHNLLSVRLWEKAHKWFWLLKITIGILLFLGAITIDFIIKVVWIIGLFAFGVLNWTLALFLLIGNAAKIFSKALVSVSEKGVLRIAIRVSVVLSFVGLVILNRYQPVFLLNDESTAILEFVASAVIIPVILEGIFSIEQSKKRQEI